jgi:hypothetical protein
MGIVEEEKYVGRLQLRMTRGRCVGTCRDCGEAAQCRYKDSESFVSMQAS